jgi:DSF synthase
MFANLRPGEAAPIKYFVGGSRIPGIYNLGGDLSFFIECIRARNLEALRNYAHDCVDVAYHMTVGFHLPLVTIALIQAMRLAAGSKAHCPSTCSWRKKTLSLACPRSCSICFPAWAPSAFCRASSTRRAPTK